MEQEEVIGHVLFSSFLLAKIWSCCQVPDSQTLSAAWELLEALHLWCLHFLPDRPGQERASRGTRRLKAASWGLRPVEHGEVRGTLVSQSFALIAPQSCTGRVEGVPWVYAPPNAAKQFGARFSRARAHFKWEQ